MAYGYIAVFALLFASGGKAYYLGSWYLPLVAVGAVVIEESWRPLRRKVLTGAVVVSGLLTAPVFTPILPPQAAVAAGLDTANSDLGGMLGWPHVVGTVASVVDGLPPDQRRSAVIFTEDYSEAGSIDFFGPALGLRSAISGHNSFWLWGYGHPAPEATVVAVGLSRTFVDSHWSSVQLATTLGSDGHAVDPQERGAAVWVCRHQRTPWPALWPMARHYD